MLDLLVRNATVVESKAVKALGDEHQAQVFNYLRIADQPVAFLKMVDHLKGKNLELESDESLKRMPRGFEAHADSEIEPYLKWKSYTTSRSYKDKDLKSSTFAREVATFAQSVYPLLQYGWEVAD